MHRFGDAQAGGVADGQDRTMLEALDTSEKMPNLIPAENARQPVRHLRSRQSLVEGPLLLQSDLVEESKCRNRDVD